MGHGKLTPKTHLNTPSEASFTSRKVSVMPSLSNFQSNHDFKHSLNIATLPTLSLPAFPAPQYELPQIRISSSFSGFTTAAFATVLRDTHVLEKSVDSFLQIADSKLPALYFFSQTEKSAALITDSFDNFAIGKKWRNTSYMTDSLINDSILNIQPSPVRTKKDWLAFEKKIEESFFSKENISGLKQGAVALNILSAFTTAYSIGTASDKVAATKEEAAATAAAIGVTSFVNKLGLSKNPRIVIPLTIASGITGSILGAEIDQTLDGKEWGPMLLQQSLAFHRDQQSIQKIHDAVSVFYEIFTNNIKQVPSESKNMFVSTVEMYQHHLQGLIKETTPVTRAYAMRDALVALDATGNAVIASAVSKTPTLAEPLINGNYETALTKFLNEAEKTPLSANNIKTLSILKHSTGVLGMTLSAYEVYKAKNKTTETAHQVALTAASIAGAAAAGLAVTPICGPAAPVCALAVVAVGSVASTSATELVWNETTSFINENNFIKNLRKRY